MKKTISNFRILAALLMAGAAFAACSSDDDIVNEQPANTGKQSYTLTVNASKGSATRALDLDGSAVVASWETTDEIVVSKNGTQIGTLSPTNINGLEATFTGTISGDADINVNGVLILSYHPVASLSAFASQNGTLNGSDESAENFDMAVTLITIKEIDGNNIKLFESAVEFENQTAVVVLAPYNNTWGEYQTITSLSISATMTLPVVGAVTEKIGPISVSGDQPHYFALPSQSYLAEILATKYSAYNIASTTIAELLNSATITFNGFISDDYFTYALTCTKTGYKFAADKYYTLDENNFKMTMLIERTAADKKVYIESGNTSWSNTVTYSLNSEIGWKLVGDNVYCGDKQLYVVDNSGPEPSEGWVKATDDHIPFDATYSLREPAPAGPTLAATMTTAGMTVKVKYSHSDEENYCQFLSNGDGSYTFQSGDGYVGGDADCAKALVFDGDNLVFKQNIYSNIDVDWDFSGFSVTFDTSNNTYSEWRGLYAANEETPPYFISVEVNGTTIDVTRE